MDVVMHVNLIGAKGVVTLVVGGNEVHTEEIVGDGPHRFAPWEYGLPLCRLILNAVSLTVSGGCEAIEVHGYKTTDKVECVFRMAGEVWTTADGTLQRATRT